MYELFWFEIAANIFKLCKSKKWESYALFKKKNSDRLKELLKWKCWHFNKKFGDWLQQQQQLPGSPHQPWWQQSFGGSAGLRCWSNSTNSDVEKADIDEAVNPEIQITNYLKAKIPHDANTLGLWSHNAEQLPLLKQMALKYLCIPATSPFSERCFLSAGLTATNLTSWLTGGHLKSLNVLHCIKLVV